MSAENLPAEHAAASAAQPIRENERVGFEALIQKVRQAETALEAKERQTGANWRQAKASWLQAWTPGRIVIAGLASGFLVGRAEPFKRAAGGGTLQLISALSGLFAGGSAQAAAGEAEQAAQSAEQAADAAEPTATRTAAPAQPQQDPRGAVDVREIPESYRHSGHL